MDLRFRPLRDYVLVQREALPELSQGGLFVLGRDYPTVGRVLAVGPGPWARMKDYYLGPDNNGKYQYFYYRRSLDLKPGDFVQWSIDSDFDLAEVKGFPPDVLLLRYDQLNIRGRG